MTCLKRWKKKKVNQELYIGLNHSSEIVIDKTFPDKQGMRKSGANRTILLEILKEVSRAEKNDTKW